MRKFFSFCEIAPTYKFLLTVTVHLSRLIDSLGDSPSVHRATCPKKSQNDCSKNEVTVGRKSFTRKRIAQTADAFVEKIMERNKLYYNQVISNLKEYGSDERVYYFEILTSLRLSSK